MRFPRSDAALVRRAKQGEDAAFAAIFERYHQDLYRYCRAIVGSPDEAQDALQSAMAKVISSLPGEEREITLKPWLYRIAHNEAISVIRARFDATEVADDDLVAPPPDVAAEHREAVRQLVGDLEDLPEKQRAALVMKELSGLSHGEIASALQITSGAARQSVYEARTALQQISEGRAMDCEYVRQAISDSDGRVMRGRRIRAHLNSCTGCKDFAAAIHTRQQVFSFAAPALPVAASSGIFAAASGGSAAISAGAGAGAFGAGSLGIVATGAIVLAGAGSLAGIQLSGGDENKDRPPAAIESVRGDERGPDTQRPEAGSSSGSQREAEKATQPGDRNGDDKRSDRGDRESGGGSQASEASSENGASEVAQAETGRPDTPPGSTVASENSNGQSTTPTTGPPAHANGPPAHSNAGGSGSNAGGNGNGNSQK